LKYLLATLTCMDKRPSGPGREDYRRLLEKRLHEGLHPKLEVTREGEKILIHITGEYTAPTLHILVRGIKRIWEWEAA
jgi:hypothetical protein